MAHPNFGKVIKGLIFRIKNDRMNIEEASNILSQFSGLEIATAQRALETTINQDWHYINSFENDHMKLETYLLRDQELAEGL